ncbi:RICIN domain-containing protein [Streptomyces sp. DSM 3412]|uniref:RICIN domain-containing protein n=1 Tax=Streptomyces gottesmaniae TaxID=3075518 RepID=A0ABU2YTQ9_9ACTN|nr:RICIN domain-containing protein [Streptomyces sp. DSM 3412]MDT0567715.1 RICIN domain-containing protein [Streptomyces sp. DSM 3412]
MSTGSTGAGDGEEFTPLISTVAGTGTAGVPPKGDKELAASALLNGPYGVAVDREGTLYIVEYGGHRIRKVTTDGKISTVAGTGSAGRGAEGVSAVSAALSHPRGIAVDTAGDLYIADSGNNRIRKITMADGKVHTFAGTGAATYGGDGGLATAAHLYSPFDVVVDGADNVYIADWGNHRIRVVTADGKISTVAGTVGAGLAPDGTVATAAQLKYPSAVAVDSAGNLYIADYHQQRVRKVTKADGKIRTVAGTGAATYGGDGVQATSAPLQSPMALVVDSSDTLYIADTNNHRVRKVAADGKISTVAGTGAATFDGDGKSAASAKLSSPHGLAVDCVDTLYIADYTNNRVRKVTSAKLVGLPDSGTVASWANVRSRLRMAVVRESTSDGAEVHQTLVAPRDHQRWQLIAAGQDDGQVLYRIENVRSGKVLEVVGAQEGAGAVVAQRAYDGADARHQHWRLIPVGPVTATPRVYEIANWNSGLLLGIDTNARTVIKQYEAAGASQDRQWQLLPV